MYLHQHLLLDPIPRVYKKTYGIVVSLVNIVLLGIATFVTVAAATVAYRLAAG